VICFIGSTPLHGLLVISGLAIVRILAIISAVKKILGGVIPFGFLAGNVLRIAHVLGRLVHRVRLFLGFLALVRALLGAVFGVLVQRKNTAGFVGTTPKF